jgi:hypothetical protein
MQKTPNKKQESTTNEEEEQYLTYTINCDKFTIIIKDSAKVKNFRVMSGQPSPPVKPPGGGNG